MAYHVTSLSDPMYTPWYCSTLAYAEYTKKILYEILRTRYTIRIRISEEGESHVDFTYPEYDLDIIEV
jgi:hypothetical protein